MFCTKCGQKLPEDLAEFCPSCGKQTKDDKPIKPQMQAKLPMPSFSPTSLRPLLTGGTAIAIIILMLQEWVRTVWPWWMDESRRLPSQFSLHGITGFLGREEFGIDASLPLNVLFAFGIICALMLLFHLLGLLRKGRKSSKAAFIITIIFAIVVLTGFPALSSFYYSEIILEAGWQIYAMPLLAVVAIVFGFDKKEKHKMCAYCKKEQPITCVYCNLEYPFDTKNCEECGNPLA
jgi:hypothetical protein